MVTKFKAAVQATDYALIAKYVRSFEAEQLSARQIFRVALAADCTLTFDAWTAIVAIAMTRHPAN